MKIILSTTAIVALVAGTVAADGVRFAQLSFDRNNYSAGDEDIDANQFVGEIEYQTGDFLISGSVENNTASDSDTDVSVREISASGGYFLSPEALVGLTFTNVDNDVADATLAGAFAQYRTNEFGVGIRVLQNLDSDDTLYLGVATFEVSPGLELGLGLTSTSETDGTGYVASANYDQGPIDGRVYFAGNSESDDNIFGVRGSYEFAGAFRGTAAFESISGGEDEYTSYKIGAGYRITDGAWVDASIGQIDPSNGEAIDTLSLSISFETGAPVRLDRAFERDLRDDFNAGAQQFVDSFRALSEL